MDLELGDGDKDSGEVCACGRKIKNQECVSHMLLGSNVFLFVSEVP